MSITLRYSSRVMVYAAILFVATLAAAIAVLIIPEDPRGYIYGAVVLLLFAAVALYVFLREKRRFRKTIVISPDGIKTEEGELVKAETIDHCYLHFCDMSISGSKYDSIDKSFYRLIVVFKDGRQKRIDLEDYGVSFKRAESFHEEVNAIEGMPLFKDPVIEKL